jgi:hypothetical protein
MAKKNKNNKKTDQNNSRKKVPGTRFNVDDPVNDIHDDELYEEETGLRKEITDDDSFERPW